jgi:hypothetical protein
MRHLANSFEPNELNGKGYGLYCTFRPPSEKWAEKSEFRLENVLSLRRYLTHGIKREAKPEIKQADGFKTEEGFTEEGLTQPAVKQEAEDEPSPSKRLKTEAELDDEFEQLDWSAFDHVP